MVEADAAILAAAAGAAGLRLMAAANPFACSYQRIACKSGGRGAVCDLQYRDCMSACDRGPTRAPNGELRVHDERTSLLGLPNGGGGHVG